MKLLSVAPAHGDGPEIGGHAALANRRPGLEIGWNRQNKRLIVMSVSVYTLEWVHSAILFGKSFTRTGLSQSGSRCQITIGDCRKIGGVSAKGHFLRLLSDLGWTRGLDCEGGENRD
jgi:hypothetical protein